MAKKLISRIDWLLFFFVLPIMAAGLVTMKSFSPNAALLGDHFFAKQIIWIGVSIAVFFFFSYIDFRFLRRTDVLVVLFLFFSVLLAALFILGKVTNGAQSWFSLGGFSF